MSADTLDKIAEICREGKPDALSQIANLICWRDQQEMVCMHPRAYLKTDWTGIQSCQKCGRYWD